MPVSVFDLFKTGIGPSSSHTMGPMIAARRFGFLLQQRQLLPRLGSITVELYGSLAATGIGHHTDKAILLGLSGERPESVDLDAIPGLLEGIKRRNSLFVLGEKEIGFTVSRHLLFKADETLPSYANGLRFTAAGTANQILGSEIYYSPGGGFVLSQAEATAPPDHAAGKDPAPYPFHHAYELLDHCTRAHLPVSELVLQNELVFRSESAIREGVGAIWRIMNECVERGMAAEGQLPGGLHLPRRAPRLARTLASRPTLDPHDPLSGLDWVDLYALAVGEENAAGGRVVTAPTNGSAGLIPAVLRYCVRNLREDGEERIFRFFLTAAAIGSLYKENASFSAAEVGCQGEIGTACSMAAGALAEFWGGSPEQVVNAAEIGMEHNLGLTCDPIKGLVQIPCIERNAMGAVKAINAARMALRRDGKQFVSLDKVIETMRQTGRDMSTKYKETARGGLAVNFPEC